MSNDLTKTKQVQNEVSFHTTGELLKKFDPEELCWPQDVIDILSTFKPLV